MGLGWNLLRRRPEVREYNEIGGTRKRVTWASEQKLRAHSIVPLWTVSYVIQMEFDALHRLWPSLSLKGSWLLRTHPNPDIGPLLKSWGALSTLMSHIQKSLSGTFDTRHGKHS